MAASLRTAAVSLHSWTNTKIHFLPKFVLRLPQGYPSAYGGLGICTAKAIRHIYIYENTWYPFQSQKEQQLNQHKGKLAAWFFSPIIERLRVEILKKIRLDRGEEFMN